VSAAITAISYHFPSLRLSNDDIVERFPGRSADEIKYKTGISERRIAAVDECASDLAVAAVNKLFEQGSCSPAQIDFLLYCTQSPDYFLPTTACILQDRLGLSTSAGALDINLGCSGFVYGLAIAKGLVETGGVRHLLLVTADTYSKFLDHSDRSVTAIFGDAACAALIEPVSQKTDTDPIGPFIFGTDGSGASNLIVREGGLRSLATRQVTDPTLTTSGPALYMNGPALMEFAIRVVPTALRDLLNRAALRMQDIDMFVFHQANKFILEHLRRKLEIPEEKFYISMNDCGNTVSCTIPIALKRANEEGRLQHGQRVALIGFGVGYSWAATLINWQGLIK
jgi:3-oxoacyl-[acyl-carrier-protein] synthase III